MAVVYRNICKELASFSSTSSFALAIWTAFAFHNTTEADFRTGLMWVVFVLAALAVSRVGRGEVARCWRSTVRRHGRNSVLGLRAATVCPEEFMNRLRILVLAPDSNPEGVSIPYVTYCHAAALATLHDVSLVVRSPVEDAVRRARAPFRSIEVVCLPWLERVYDWSFRWIFKSNFASQAVTAFGYPFALAFEWRAWKQLRQRILSGEFDVVLRLLPMTAVLPSPFAFLLRKGSTPFVIGPINGGLPFVTGFSQASAQKEWISNLRGLYRFLPFARSTYRDAAAIVVASSQTYAEFAVYRDKLFFVPENGVIGRSLCSADSRSPAPGARLELIFVGGLIPCKACDSSGCARPRAFCEVIWRALLCLAMVQSGPVSRSSPRPLGSKRLFPFVVG